MMKAYVSVSKKYSFLRALCMLLLVFGTMFLSACKEEEATKVSTDKAAVAAVEQSLKGCWMCPLFEATESAAVGVAMGTIPNVAGAGIRLLAVAYGLWLAIYIMKHAASLKEPDLAAFWKTMATQAFWVAMGAALLLDLKMGGKWSAVNAFAKPVYNAFVNAGLMISGGIGGPGAGSGMSAIVRSIQGQLNFGGIAGATMLFSVKTFSALPYGIMGVIFIGTSVVLMLWIPALLLSCTFRYGIALFMLPLAVGAYVFKPTRPFTGKVAKIYVEVGFALMGMCAYAACAVKILTQYTGANAPYLNSFPNYQDDELLEMTSDGGVFGTLFLAFFLVMYAEVALELFSQFAQGMGGIGAVGKGVVNFGKKGLKLANTVRKFAVLRRQRALDKKAAKDWAMHKDAKGGIAKQKAMKAKERLTRRGFLDKHGNTTKDFAKLARGDKALLNFRKADIKSQGAARERMLSMRNAALDKSTSRLKDRTAAGDRLSGMLRKRMANAKGPFKAVKKAVIATKLMALKAKKVSNKVDAVKNKISKVGNNIKRVGNAINTKRKLVGNAIQNTKAVRAVNSVAKYGSGVVSDVRAAHNSGLGTPNTRGPAQGVDQKHLDKLKDRADEATGGILAHKLDHALGAPGRMKRNIQRAPGRALKKIGLGKVAAQLGAKHGGNKING